MCRYLLHCLCFLPIKKNRVFFESFSGANYNCNPKYISEHLNKKYKDTFEIVWAFKDTNINVPQYIVKCKYRSLTHIYYRLTSKFYISNFLQADEIPKRKGQIYIQTWHGGGCYKKVGKEEKLRNSIYSKRQKIQLNETDFFLTSSMYWEDEVLRKQFEYKGQALSIGMPRNDLLVSNSKKLRKLIRQKLGINENQYFILYAPTWRENNDVFEPLDVSNLKKYLATKHGKDVIVGFRSHVYGKEKNIDMVDFSNYPDMQELLLACDSLITDYSSSMWDFSILKKPCYLFVPDLKRYLDQRGFDRDIYSWGFDVCKTNEELFNAINSYNEKKIITLMEKHQNDLISFEKGNASELVVKLIYDESCIRSLS